MTIVDRSRLPAPHPAPSFRFPVVRRQALGNGLRVWTVEHRELPVLSFVLLLRSGSADDPADRRGLSALTADMLDEGSDGRSALDVEDALSRLGAQLDTEVGADASVLSLITLSRFRDAALDLLAEIVARPRFDPAELDRVRDLRLTRLRQMRDVAPAVADRMLARLLFPGHPYGHFPLGVTRALKAATSGEVSAFHARAWHPSRLTLIAVGDGTHDELVAAAERALGWWQPGGPLLEDSPPPLPPASPGAKLAVVDRPGAAQTELRVGLVAAPRVTPDYHALIVLNAILGGQFVSRLNMNLREAKGYTYGVRSGFDFRRGPGPFIVQAAVQTAATAESVREVLREAGALGGEQPPTPAEIDLARSSLTLGYPRNFETSVQIARGLVQLELYGLADDTFEQFVPSVERVDARAIVAASRRLDPARMTVALVGDLAKIGPSLEALGLGEPLVMRHEDLD